MPSPIYQNMVNLIVGFPILRHPSIFMDVAMWEHSTFDCAIFRCAKFTTLTLSLLISCKLSFPIIGLKMSSLSTLALKPPVLTLNLTYILIALLILVKLLTFHVPNLVSIFCRLGHLSKVSVQARGSYDWFVTHLFFKVRDC
jgi:hypothetical protein